MMKIKVCLVQDSPVFFNKEKTIEKIEELVKKYAAQGAQLIVFPESFIPGYPRGLTFGATVGNRTDEGRKMYAEYHKNSFDISSDDLKILEELSNSQNVYLVIGVTEKQSSNGSLYCSMLYISPKAGLMGVHRKIKPTGSERIVWGESDGKGLVSFNTEIGKLGGLICWENYMPLARVAMYKQAVQIYIAPTADARETWPSTMRHIALEGRCFVLGCNQYFERSMYPDKYRSLVETEPEIICRGGSIIVAPSGKIIAGPLFDKAGALQAVIDLDEIILSKLDFDPVGHYARDDIFEFKVLNQPGMKQE
jgi:nitrilase